MSVFYSAALVLLIHIALYPDINAPRRFVGQFLDISAASLCLAWSGEYGSPAYGVYLWVTVGNGFRFGLPYMYSAAVLSLVAFPLVAFVAPFWNEHVVLSSGLLLALCMIPAYLAALLRRLETSKRNLESLAREDSLTGALNRRSLENRLHQETARLERYGGELAIAMFDIDSFKPINDNFGHFLGDEVLRAVIERARSVLRESDYVARFGGDEFVAVLPTDNETAAVKVAGRIRRAIDREPFHYENHTLRLSISVGVSHWIKGDSVEHLLRKADVALYYSKSQGRNRVSSFHELPERERQLIAQNT